MSVSTGVQTPSVEKTFSKTATPAPSHADLNDNSNPQQGTGTRGGPGANPGVVTVTRSESIPNQRAPLKIPPTVKDVRKLFVGGLPSDVTTDEFRCFFEQFGKVAESVVMYDHVTNRSRGFGFVTFEDASVCTYLLSLGHDHETASQNVGRIKMRGKTVEIKSAEPKAAMHGRAARSSGSAIANIHRDGVPMNCVSRPTPSRFSTYPYPSSYDTDFYPPNNEFYAPYYYPPAELQGNTHYYFPVEGMTYYQQPIAPMGYGYVPTFNPEDTNYDYPMPPAQYTTADNLPNKAA